ncbi:MAG: hypothetical protein LBH98_05560 [Chitinispirillales bacterium]|jgi:hypothetical protein|nr:hypothetical protein [Chitinispirillales bacterium]
MKIDIKKIKLDKTKKNIVLIGNNYGLMDLIEIYLYKYYNIITTTNEFDGIKKIEYFSPVCIFIKTGDDLNSLLSTIKRIKKEPSNDIPITTFSNKNISTINEFKMKSAGINEIIKFPIIRQDFMTIFETVVKL